MSVFRSLVLILPHLFLSSCVGLLTGHQVSLAEDAGDSVSEGENDDGLSDGLLPAEHRIFITSATYDGNLGGIAGANAKCQTHAIAAGLTRNYKALLSDSTNDVKDLITVNGAIYNFSSPTTKVLVANFGAELWNARAVNLVEPIEYDDAYENLSEPAQGFWSAAWSGSDDFGVKDSDVCLDWSTNVPMTDAGEGGAIGAVAEEWFYSAGGYDCDALNHLYCISQ